MASDMEILYQQLRATQDLTNLLLANYLDAPKTPEGYSKVTHTKSLLETNKVFISHDFTDKCTWWFSSVDVKGAIGKPDADYITYSFPNTHWIDKRRITNRADIEGKNVTIYKNGAVVTAGITINHAAGTVTFATRNSADDVITADYSYAGRSRYELIARPGRKIEVVYAETQFSVGVKINDSIIFELALNNPNTNNSDIIVHRQEYRSAKDFLNMTNIGVELARFGELTTNVIILPWSYLAGYAIKPIGDPTTDPRKKEFNKMILRLENDIPLEGEIATGSFYAFIKPLQ